MDQKKKTLLKQRTMTGITGRRTTQVKIRQSANRKRMKGKAKERKHRIDEGEGGWEEVGGKMWKERDWAKLKGVANKGECASRAKQAASSIGVRYIGGHGGVYVCLFVSDLSAWL